MSGLNFLDNVSSASGPWPGFIVGVFHYDGKKMHWSEETYKLYGYAPGKVVPTPEFMLSHVHPLDRVAVERLWTHAGLGAAQFCAAFRLIDATGSERRVLMYGQGLDANRGMSAVLQGCLFDLTDLLEREARKATQAAVGGAVANRESVDRAAGILMCHLGVTAKAALQILMTGSSNTNITVRDLAEDLIHRVEEGPDGPGIDAFLASLRLPPQHGTEFEPPDTPVNPGL